MSKKDNHNIPDNQDKIVSSDRLKKYFDNELSPAEEHQVERAMMASSLESDAFEGLDKNSFDKIENIRKNIPSLLQEEATPWYRQPRYAFAAAAAIFVLFTGSFLLIMDNPQQETSIAMESVSAEDKEANQTTEEIIERPAVNSSDTMLSENDAAVEKSEEKSLLKNEESFALSKDSIKSKAPRPSEIEADFEEKENVTPPSDYIAMEEQVEADQEEPVELRMNPRTAANSVSPEKLIDLEGDSIKAQAIASDMLAFVPEIQTPYFNNKQPVPNSQFMDGSFQDITYDSKEAKKKKKSTDTLLYDRARLFEDGITALNSKKFAKADKLFDLVLLQEPNNEPALFYNALANLHLNNPDKALSKLNQLPEDTLPEVKWYKGAALMMKNKELEALKILKTLSEQTNPYQQKASEILNDNDR